MCPDWTDTLNRREAGEIAGFDGSNETKADAAERHAEEDKPESERKHAEPTDTRTPQGFSEPAPGGDDHGHAFPSTE